jgi:hypothetical protein
VDGLLRPTRVDDDDSGGGDDVRCGDLRETHRAEMELSVTLIPEEHNDAVIEDDPFSNRVGFVLGLRCSCPGKGRRSSGCLPE